MDENSFYELSPAEIPFALSAPSLSDTMEIALYRPEIPPNTGNIARLSVCTASRLHIIGKPSFSMDESAVKRAGLDYWDQVDLHLHEEWDPFLSAVKRDSDDSPPERRILLISKFGERSYTDHTFDGSEILVFGRESTGLPTHIHTWMKERDPERILRIPVRKSCRSLNLANAVAVVTFHALQSLGFPELEPTFGSGK